ncbi:DUF1049 domain-containing protein [Novosphingobium bradum]|uniref:DUF1049 domain-containing protein n=1 Tax=Novosphingobium bradum TaxID=1737444 RepID=A0ABV7ITE4_9SPHN
MRIVRTITWVVLIIALILFSLNNWATAVTAEGKIVVKIWEGLLWETRLPFLVVIAFLVGWLPTWLVHIAGRWRLKRRISALEAASRQPTAALTITQLDAARQSGETPPATAAAGD